MKVLVTVNEKGGVGKTTLCAYAIWHAVDTGRRVLAIDLDQQANLTDTLGDFQANVTALDLFLPNTPIQPVGPLTVVRATKDLLDIEQTRDETAVLAFRDNVLRAAGHFDLCVIDTPPSLGVRAVAALLTADATVAPFDLGEYSVLGIQRVLGFQQQVSEELGAPAPKFLGLIASRFDRRSVLERDVYQQLVDEAAKDGGIPLFPHYLTKRDAYARSALLKIPAWQMSGSAAREASSEIRGLLNELDRRLFNSGG